VTFKYWQNIMTSRDHLYEHRFGTVGFNIPLDSDDPTNSVTALKDDRK